VLKVSKVFKDLRATQGHRGLRDHKEPKGQSEPKEILVLRVPLVHRGHKE
jgi:hypothetical protein